MALLTSRIASAWAMATVRMRIASASAWARGVDLHLLRVRRRLGDLGRAKLGLAQGAQGVLLQGVGVRDDRRVLGLALLEVAHLVVHRLLGGELGLARAPLLVGLHDVGVRLRLDRRLAAAGLRDLALDLLDVQGVEDEAQVLKLAGAGALDDDREPVVVLDHARGQGGGGAGELIARVLRGCRRCLKLTFALNSSSWWSRLIARRPVDVSRSVRVEVWTGIGIAKKRFAAVRIISFESPTETMALARTRTLIGRGLAAAVDVGGLVGDVEVDVDRLAGDGGAGGEERDLLGLAGALVDVGVAAQEADEADRARVHRAQEHGGDDREHDEEEDEDAADDEQG